MARGQEASSNASTSLLQQVENLSSACQGTGPGNLTLVALLFLWLRRLAVEGRCLHLGSARTVPTKETTEQLEKKRGDVAYLSVPVIRVDRVATVAQSRVRGHVLEGLEDLKDEESGIGRGRPRRSSEAKVATSIYF